MNERTAGLWLGEGGAFLPGWPATIGSQCVFDADINNDFTRAMSLAFLAFLLRPYLACSPTAVIIVVMMRSMPSVAEPGNRFARSNGKYSLASLYDFAVLSLGAFLSPFSALNRLLTLWLMLALC